MALLLALLLQSQATLSSADNIKLQAGYGKNDPKLSSHLGRPVLIQFWATWCGWCKSTHPSLGKLSKRSGENGPVVFGVSYQKMRTIRRYGALKKVGFTLLRDKGRKLHKRWKITGTPTVMLFKRDGTLAYRGMGVSAVKKSIRLARQL